MWLEGIQPAVVGIDCHCGEAVEGQQFLHVSRGITAYVAGLGGDVCKNTVGTEVGIAEVVAGISHRLENILQRFGNIEIAGADTGFADRVVIEHHRDAPVLYRLLRHARIVQATPDSHLDTWSDWLVHDD